jgi:hypothetical protein
MTFYDPENVAKHSTLNIQNSILKGVPFAHFLDVRR